MSVRVRDLTGDWRVVWEGEATPGRRFRDFDEALRFVSRWRHDPLTVTALRSLLAQRDLSWGALRDDALVARCAQLLALGRLRCVRVVPIRVDDIARAESDAHDTIALDDFLPEEARKTWIEIELTDMEGNPMAGERYWIELPDGTVREGALNAQGRAYFGGLDPGECEIRWPDLDEEATVPGLAAVSAPRREPPEARDWIEIELTDMEGNPMVGERYWIRLPDGTVRQGLLDAEGRAFFGDLDAGECEVRWPDLDGEASIPGSDVTVGHRDLDSLIGWHDPEDEVEAAQAAALIAAAADGVPFCGECPRGAEQAPAAGQRGAA